MTHAQVAELVLICGTIGFGLYGGWRGAIRQLSSVAAFLVAFLAARLFGPQLAAKASIPGFLSYALIFAAFFVGVCVLAKVLRLTVKLLLLGPVDRMLGLLIGALKWIALSSLILNTLEICGMQGDWMQTPIAERFMAFMPWLFGLMSQS